MQIALSGTHAFAIIAQSETNEPDPVVTVGIGIAQPKDKTLHGYLTEKEQVIGIAEEDVEMDVIEMAIENLVTDWFDPGFDSETVYRKGKKNYTIEGRTLWLTALCNRQKAKRKTNGR